MKRDFWLAALVGVALTGCVSEEVSPEAKQKEVLNFSAPVMATQSRVNVYGEITGVKYDTGESFGVFCQYYAPNVFAGWSNTEGNYWGDDPWIKTVHAGTYWTTDGKTYYWPDDYNLAFAAFSPEEFVPAATSIAHTQKGLQIKDFKTAASADEQYDLMYSDRIVDLNKANSGNTAVPIKFHHALSSIVFSTTKAGTDNVVYTITGVKLHGKFIQEADFDQNIDENQNMTSSFITDGQGNVTNRAQWIDHAAAAEANYTPSVTSFDVPAGTYTQFTSGPSALLLIPQSVPDDAYVTLSYKKDGLPHEATIPLNKFSTDNDPSSSTGKITKWEMGKRYIYRIAFGANSPIVFDPSTTDWETHPTLIYTIQ